MKRILALLSLIALSFPALARDEEVSAVSLSAFTNAVPASTTYTNTSTTDVVDIQGWRNVSLQVEVAAAAAATDNVTLLLVRSLSTARSSTAGFLSSAATVETLRPCSFVFALNGTNTQRAITNLPASYLDGVSGLKVYSVQNGSTQALSGLTIKFLRKRTS